MTRKANNKRQLPRSMAGFENIYLAEPIRPDLSFMRVCTNPKGHGEHTTISTSALNLKASMACW